MSAFHTIRLDDRAGWSNIVSKAKQHDFYHLPGYHSLAERQGNGTAHLFVYSDGDQRVMLPLLLRPIEQESGLERVGEGWSDGTSVYGYPGPIASGTITTSFLADFRSTLDAELRKLRVVSVFSRLHPLLPQLDLLTGLGKCPLAGKTVSIDLTRSLDEQRAEYRQDHRQGLAKLTRVGVTCLHDRNKLHLSRFIEIYRETMERVKAAPGYFFDQAYFEDLVHDPEANVQLFVCLLEGTIVSAGLFTVCDGIVQYHLSGTGNDFLKLSPMKLLIDMVRIWASKEGLRSFHLGGGIGAGEDSLFLFKAGFSELRHDFHTWQWVLMPEIFEALRLEKLRWASANSLVPSLPDYFPGYRVPMSSLPVR